MASKVQQSFQETIEDSMCYPASENTSFKLRLPLPGSEAGLGLMKDSGSNAESKKQ